MGCSSHGFDSVGGLARQRRDDYFRPAIQRFSPVDGFVAPIPAYMPGYEDDIIMAAGTFIQGASIGYPPMNVAGALFLVCAGGLTYEHNENRRGQCVNDVFYGKK